MRRGGYILIRKVYSRGYTLIELLVVLSIISVIFGIGFVGYREFSRRQQVISTARGIKSDLKNAQERAISGNKPDGCSGTLQGFAFNVTGVASYSLEAVCDTKVSIKDVALSENLTLTPPSTNPIVFLPIGLGTSLPRDETVTISVTQVATGFTQTVAVSWTGEIK